jgi:branched-chain amino acid aminotransferase
MTLRRQAISLWSPISFSSHKWLSHHLLSQRSWQNVSARAISSSHLTIEKKSDRSNWENRPKKEDLQFGTTLSDHMLKIEWNKENGWGTPRIVPYQDLQISPAASCLHYGKSRRKVW